MPSAGVAAASTAVDLEDLAEALDGAWMLLCSALVMLTQLGFAIKEAGVVQERNLASVLTQNLLVLMVGAVAWLLLGCALASHRGMEVGMSDEEQAASLFSLLLCMTTVIIAVGGMAERARSTAHAAVALAVAAAIYPLAVRWTRSGGWLVQALDPPFHDGAGGATLHIVGGLAAAVGARLAAPRQPLPAESSSKRRQLRRHSDRQKQNKPYKAPSVVFGTLVLWFGWYGFSAISTEGLRTKAQALAAARAAVNTTLAAVSGGLAAHMARMDIWRHALRRCCCSNTFPAAPQQKGKVSAIYDPVACCLGALSGLVAIAAGSDCVENSAAMAVGALGAVASIAGGRALKALKVEDPLEAGAVHGCAGAAGVLAVGLLHRHDGLFVGRGWNFLLSQLVGTLAIGIFTVVASTLLFGVLRLVGVVGLQKQRHKEELGSEAFQELLAILDHSHLCLEDTLEALTKLRGVIWRPFSPQAGNNKIDGEVLDICSLLSYTVKPTEEYLAFISHYKAEGGDAARIVYDRVTCAVLTHVGWIDESPGSRSPCRSPLSKTCTFSGSRSPSRSPCRTMMLDSPSRSSRQSGRTQRTISESVEGALRETLTRQLPKTVRRVSMSETTTQVHNVESEGSFEEEQNFGSEGTADNILTVLPPRLPGEIGPVRGPMVTPQVSRAAGCLNSQEEDPKSRLSNDEFNEQGCLSSASTSSPDVSAEEEYFPPSVLALRNLLAGNGQDDPQLDAERLLFLDSCELRDLDELLNAVRRSSNFVILLTKGVLTRPWVLAELSVAVAEQKNIVAVRIEWPGKDDEKHFNFPDCIDAVTWQLELYLAENQRYSQGGSSIGMRDVMNMLVLRNSHSHRRRVHNHNRTTSEPSLGRTTSFDRNFNLVLAPMPSEVCRRLTPKQQQQFDGPEIEDPEEYPVDLA